MCPHPPEADAVRLVRGSFHLPRELCDRCFPGTVSVALLKREGRVMIVPLAADSAGGILLKQRNARGDRVIQAQEFLRQQGIPEEFGDRPLAVRWCRELAALEVEGLPEA